MILKFKPEDFIVEEKLSFKKVDHGRYIIITVEKKGYSTEYAASVLTKYFRIQRKMIGYAGMKDQQAITTQYMSIDNKYENVSKEKIAAFAYGRDDRYIRVIFQGYANQPISLGVLDGNYFTITARDMDLEKIKIEKEIFFINYFDEQRFSKHNLDIGFALLKKNFAKACSLLIEGNHHFSEKMRVVLEKEPRNFIAALQMVPLKLLLLFIHAVQSQIFNECAKQVVEQETNTFVASSFVFPQKPLENRQLIMPGFDMKSDEGGVKSVLQQYDVTPQDFIIRQIPGLSCECSTRMFLAKASEIAIEQSQDECFPNKVKYVIKFLLHKGSYATIFMKYLLLRPN